MSDIGPTVGGQLVLRVKARVVIPGSEWSAQWWRNNRAKSLARMIAWHRIRPQAPGRDTITKPIILRDIIPDIGWPKMRWLKKEVRKEMSRIRANLIEAERL